MALLSPTRPRAIPRPSDGVWPGLFDVPRVPVHAAIARRVAKAAFTSLPITLSFPDGTRWGTGGPRLDIVRPEAFFARLGADGLIGFGEAWMTGDLTAGGWIVPTPYDPMTGPSAAAAEEANAATDELAAQLVGFDGTRCKARFTERDSRLSQQYRCAGHRTGPSSCLSGQERAQYAFR